LPGWPEATRDGGKGLAAEPRTKYDDGLVVHPHEAAEFGEPAAGQGGPLAGADGAERVATLGGGVGEEGPEVGLSCLRGRAGFQGVAHQ
jgi:hypothetical protein